MNIPASNALRAVQYTVDRLREGDNPMDQRVIELALRTVADDLEAERRSEAERELVTL